MLLVIRHSQPVTILVFNLQSVQEERKNEDGFYAADGQGKDFYIAFYEGGAGDVAYVNDGNNDVVAAYTVEKQKLDDGTEYLLVNVGNTKLGYYEEGGNVFLIDNDGHVYNAARLTEDQIEKLHAIVTTKQYDVFQLLVVLRLIRVSGKARSPFLIALLKT